MRKALLALVLLAGVGVGWYALSPWVALDALGDAIESGDEERLAARVDFPLLRDNLKQQIRERMMRGAADELDEHPLGALALGFASTLVDGLVDAFVTPAGVAELVRGRGPPLPPARERERRPRDDDEEGDRPAPDAAPGARTGETPAPPARARDDAADEGDDPFANARLERDGLDRFTVVVPAEERDDDVRLVFRRYGLSWRLTDVRLPH